MAFTNRFNIPGSNTFNDLTNFDNIKTSEIKITNSISIFGGEQIEQQNISYTVDSIVDTLVRYGFATENVWQETNQIISGDNIGLAKQGTSVSISEDGNTVAIGGPDDDSNLGACWIYVYDGTSWTEQQKIVVSDNIGSSLFGSSVSVYEDTVVIGGPGDNSGIGATWVFTRTGLVWSQQGKLIGTGNVGSSKQGSSVSIYEDTIVIGGPEDDSNYGAVWVFTRTGSVWSQQGSKLNVSDNIGSTPKLGTSVDIYEDTLVFGAVGDDTNIGGTWVFTRTGTTWSQQGAKLVGNNYTGVPAQGTSISIYNNTLVIGGPDDYYGIGAIWIFSRSGATWTQISGPLVGTGFTNNANQGISVSVYDNTIAVGGNVNNLNVGSVWVYTYTTEWIQESRRITGINYTGFPLQGSSVECRNNKIIIGGPADNSDNGSAWIFEK